MGELLLDLGVGGKGIHRHLATRIEQTVTAPGDPLVERFEV